MVICNCRYEKYPLMPGSKWGMIDPSDHLHLVQRHGIYLHIVHQGREITDDCTWADDIDDYAIVLVKDSHGHAQMSRQTGDVVKRRLSGILIFAHPTQEDYDTPISISFDYESTFIGDLSSSYRLEDVPRRRQGRRSPP